MTSRTCWTTLVLGSLILGACSLPAATYYVKPNGDDTKDGLSDGNAWKTVAKVNAATFQPGDSIAFQRGGEWRATLAASSNGAAGNPIAYDAYGSGAKPKFLGSDVLTNSSFTQSGGQYTYAAPNLPGGAIYVLEDHLFIGNGPATYNNPTLTITPSSDPRTNSRVYTVCTRGNTIFSNGKSHLVFRNLVADETAGQNGDGAVQGYGIRIEGSTDVLVENCEGNRSGRHNIAAINATQVTFRGCFADFAAPNYDGGNSFYVAYADGNAPVAKCSVTFENCTAAHLEKNSGGDRYNFLDSHGDHMGALTFKNCAVQSKASFMLADVSIIGGTVYDHGSLELWGANTVVDGVTLKDNAAVDCWASDCIVQNCISYDAPADAGPTGYTCSVLFRDGALRGIVRFNTFNAGGNAIVFKPKTSQYRMYGNVFKGSGKAVALWDGTGATGDIAYADYNFYDPATKFQVAWADKTVAEWKGFGFDTHSLTGDPQFTDEANHNYALKSSSACIDAAVLTAPDSAPAKDITGRNRPQGTRADIGAYEYASGALLPPSITTQPASQTVQAGQTATFSVVASGSETLTYRWQRNNGAGWSDIGGATSASYQIATVIGDNNAQFQCVVSNNVPPDATSDAATLTVTAARGPRGGTPWPVPGTIQAEDFDVGGQGVSWFDQTPGSSNVYRTSDVEIEATPVAGGDYNIGNIEPGEWLEYTMDVASDGSYTLESFMGWPGAGGAVFHYEINGVNVSGPVTIPQSNGYWWDWRSVRTTGVELKAGVQILRVAFDTANGNGEICNFDSIRISPDERTADGTILYEYWLGIDGAAVSALTSSPKFSGPPDGSRFLSSFEGPITWADNFGARMSGTLTAPQTGSYTFVISGDDNCELWLSTDTTPANAQLIARVPGATRPREWNKYPEQQSQPVALQAGTAYYVYALQKEGGNDDNVAVGWTLPDGTQQRPIPGTVLSAATRKPAITSGPTATPNPARVSQEVQMNAAAEDADGDTLTYLWNFGDGTSANGAAASHTFLTAGNFLVSLTVSDGHAGTASASLSVSVVAATDSGTGGGATPPPGGTSGDTGGNGGTLLPLKVLKLAGSAKFSSSGKDSCSLSAILEHMPAGFDPSGLSAMLDIGGAQVPFVINAKGKAQNTNGSLQLKIKGKRNKATKKLEFLGGSIPVKAKIQKGSWAQVWADEGVMPGAREKKRTTFAVTLTLGQQPYTAAVDTLYTGKGTSATFKR